jgi:DNA-directed RNA polymerase alpha subunit
MEKESIGIDGLEITIQTHGILSRAGISSIEQLAVMSRNDLLKIRGIGSERIREISSALCKKIQERMNQDA